MTNRQLVCLCTILFMAWAAPFDAAAESPVHGFAMRGEPKYAPDFTHFDYVNPKAPKRGALRLHAIGTFDGFNPFVVKGNPPSGIGLVYDTLTKQAEDEVFSEYGLVAERFAVADDRSWVTFYLNPKAQFSDGKPITARDVAFSYDILVKQGRPLYALYYADVASYEIIDSHTITFRFRQTNPELPLILGQLPLLPEHYWKDRDFNAALTEVPVTSGPYRIGEFDMGKSITYERDPHYWGQTLAVNVGYNNFDRISYIYFLDSDVAMEAFKSNSYDYRIENNSTDWATEYDFPALQQGKVTKVALTHQRPTGMQSYVFNTRRPIFADPLVREALSYAFDFEWSNANLFYDSYFRTSSYFSNSDLASSGLPSEQELQLLNPWRDQLPKRVFTDEYVPPSTQNTPLRNNLRKGMQLLRQAGWFFSDGKLTNKAGEYLQFEILLYDKGGVRIANPMVQNLKRMGVDATINMVEVTQYINRLNNYDFDMVSAVFGQSSSPGNEQREFWGSSKANQPGSRNLPGISNPAIDALIENVIVAGSRQELITATRALDRALLWGHYVIPQFHSKEDRIAYWDTIERPQQVPSKGVNIMTWWAKP